MIDYKTYSDSIDIKTKNEFDKVLYTALYMTNTGRFSFMLEELKNLMQEHGAYISNWSRIKKKMKTSNMFKCVEKDKYALTTTCMNKYKEELENFKDFTVIQSNSGLLDENVFTGNIKYLDSLVRQANNCYENNCYDACATMIRRILEILLIKSYEKLGIQVEIKDAQGNYYMLEKICSNARSNKTLNLSRLKNELDSIRELGNFAAHRIEFNTTKKDIDDKKDKLRPLLEELLYKSGLRV